MQQKTGYLIAIVAGVLISSIGVWSIVATFSAPPPQHSGVIVARYQSDSNFHFIVNESGQLEDIAVPSTVYFTGPANGQTYQWAGQLDVPIFGVFVPSGIIITIVGFVFADMWGTESATKRR